MRLRGGLPELQPRGWQGWNSSLFLFLRGLSKLDQPKRVDHSLHTSLYQPRKGGLRHLWGYGLPPLLLTSLFHKFIPAYLHMNLLAFPIAIFGGVGTTYLRVREEICQELARSLRLHMGHFGLKLILHCSAWEDGYNLRDRVEWNWLGAHGRQEEGFYI